MSEGEQFDNLLSQKRLNSVFHASVLLLTMNFIITFSKYSSTSLQIYSCFDNIMTKFMINNRPDA